MLKKLAKCLREYKAVTIFTMLCMVVEAAMEVLIPLLIFRFGKCVQPTGGGSPDIDGMILNFAAICSKTFRVFRLQT